MNEEKLYLCIDGHGGLSDRICKGLKGLQANARISLECWNADLSEQDDDYIKANTDTLKECLFILQNDNYVIYELNEEPFSYVDITDGLIVNHNIKRQAKFENSKAKKQKVVFVNTNEITFDENNMYSIY